MSLPSVRILAVLLPLLSSLCCQQAAENAAARNASPVSVQADAPIAPQHTYLLHLPGIGGHMRIDDNLLRGLQKGSAADELELYDWTGADRGMISLGNVKRHEQQSQLIADALAQRIREHPRERIILTGHSAGAGIAVFALEKLPDDLKIDTLVLMQPALSPGYDLSKALRHVRGRAYAFYSPLDLVLSQGTKLMGTVDRVQTEAAGCVGFVVPPPKALEPKQYGKLTQFAYQDSWTRFDDIGDHIGPMTAPFAREMIAPLIRTGELPSFDPTTQRSSQ
jgi:pimeloyl-ACP methyl ester carboxylesterase